MMPLIIFCLGLGSIVSQFVYLRELQTTFQGNELSLSLALFSWLFGSGIGGLLGFRLSIAQPNNKARLKSILSLSLMLSAFWLFAGLFLVRALKPLLSISPFEIVNPGQILLISSIVVIPQTFTVGLSFLLVCSIIQNPLKAYLLEALGAFSAGLLSLVLIEYFNSCQILWGTALFYAASSLLLLDKKHPYFPAAAMLLAFSLILSLAIPDWIQENTQGLRFKSQRLIYSTDSIYANIAIAGNNEHAYSLYENGKLSFSTEDGESIEEFSHMLLLTHPAPRRILLIAGGLNGIIPEMLKHPAEAIDYLEPDKKLIESVLKYIPQSSSYGLKEKNVNIYNQDPRIFVKTTLNKYDLIILNSGGPSSLQLNRLYTKEFFEEIKRILNPRGRFCFSLESKEDILSGQLLKYNSCLYKSAQSAFPYLQIIPGERLTIIGSEENIPEINPEELSARFRERGIQSKYFTPHHIKAKLFRQEYVQKRLEENSGTSGVNRDYRPLGFFSYLSLRGKQSRMDFSRIWELAGKIKPAYWIGAMLVPAFFLRKNIINLSIFSSGFYGIALEIIISLLFQINLGFLYYRLGMIVAIFMSGLSLGGILFLRLDKTRLSWKKELFLSETTLGLLSLFSAFILKDNQTAYFLLTLLIGIIIGFEFGIFYGRQKTITVYILDLAGASAGSLLTGLIFIPVLGIYNTCLLIACGKIINAFFLRIPGR